MYPLKNGARQGRNPAERRFRSSRKVRGANKGLGEAPKSCTRKEHESATNSIAKRGQGAIAPCRVKGQRPLWGLGQRPNCSASNLLKGRSQQGAGSEASLPVTSRVRRRAPKLLFPQDSVKNCRFLSVLRNLDRHALLEVARRKARICPQQRRQ